MVNILISYANISIVVVSEEFRHVLFNISFKFLWKDFINHPWIIISSNRFILAVHIRRFFFEILRLKILEVFVRERFNPKGNIFGWNLRCIIFL